MRKIKLLSFFLLLGFLVGTAGAVTQTFTITSQVTNFGANLEAFTGFKNLSPFQGGLCPDSPFPYCATYKIESTAATEGSYLLAPQLCFKNMPRLTLTLKGDQISSQTGTFKCANLQGVDVVQAVVAGNPESGYIITLTKLTK